MRAVARRWTPAELTVDYRLANGMMASEVRTVQPGGVFASEWLVQGLRHAPLQSHRVDRARRGRRRSLVGGLRWRVRISHHDLRRARRGAARARGARVLRRHRELGRLSRRARAECAALGAHTVRGEVGGRRTCRARCASRAAPRMRCSSARCTARSTSRRMARGARSRCVSRRSICRMRAGDALRVPRADGHRRVERRSTRARRDARRREPAAMDGALLARAGLPVLGSIPRALLLVSLVRAVAERDRARHRRDRCARDVRGDRRAAHALGARGAATLRELRWLDSPELRARRAARRSSRISARTAASPARIFADHRSGVGVAQSNWGDAISRSMPCGPTMRFFARCTRRCRATPIGSCSRAMRSRRG